MHSFESQKRTSQPTFIEKIKVTMTDKCFIFLLLASAFRFMGGYAIGFWGETFFKNVYPH
jgi:hypothetical protein